MAVNMLAILVAAERAVSMSIIRSCRLSICVLLPSL